MKSNVNDADQQEFLFNKEVSYHENYLGICQKRKKIVTSIFRVVLCSSIF